MRRLGLLLLLIYDVCFKMAGQLSPQGHARSPDHSWAQQWKEQCWRPCRAADYQPQASQYAPHCVHACSAADVCSSSARMVTMRPNTSGACCSSQLISQQLTFCC